MRKRSQILLSTGLVTAAVAAVAIHAATGRSEQAGGMEGHNHAAMSGGGDGAEPVRLAEADRRRIGVTYAPVERETLERSVRTVGRVAYDETRLVDVSPKITGWVERLHVDFTGAPIRRGEPLLEVYSPALVSAQEELILARRLVEETADAPDSRAARNADELLASARRRLAYWDIPEDEIRRIEETGEATKTITLRAPASGIVVEKDVVEGARIRAGAKLYRIADLSTVWVEADVFEKDLSLVSEGQRAEVRLEAYPGESLDATVTYVYPTVETHARTGRIRLELSNPGLRLKPGMYANVDLRVPAGRSALTVPRSAVLDTGERTLVFVRAADGALVPTGVTTGLSVGDRIEVASGLEEGETVVSSANFLVDAESKLGSLTGGMEMDDGEMEMEDGEMEMEDGEADAGTTHETDAGASPDGKAGMKARDDHSSHGG